MDINYIKSLFRYEDGKLFWLSRPSKHFKDAIACDIWNKRFCGKEAGYLQIMRRKGRKDEFRWKVGIDYKKYNRSNLVWAICKNEWRIHIDHKDNNSTNDCVENLRLATINQNRANSIKRSDNTTGYKGVYLCKKCKKYVSRIHYNNKCIVLGYFVNIKDAYNAYAQASQKYHGEFSNIG